MPTITVPGPPDGRLLHYEDCGAGEPLLLLHGFPMHAGSFWPLLEQPPRHLRVLAPDHRGFGGSHAGDGPLHMETIARDALALLDALGIGRAFVGGVSMGGYAAMALLRLAPDRVRGLVLLGTHARADDEAGKARREATAREVETQGIEPLVRAMLPTPLARSAPEAVRERLAAILLATPPAAASAAARGMAARPDSRATLAAWRGPSLIVHGSGDAVIPIERGRELAELLRRHDGACEYQELPVGHMPQLEAADACRDALVRLRDRADAV